MRNPYEILGIPQGAGMEQVNAAYREMLRIAQSSGDQRKIDELNQAYDTIVMGSSGSSASGYSAGGYSNPSTADYSDIRAKINSGRLDDAQILLDGIPEYSREAQWYYLKGTVQQKRGWLEEAAKNFATASNLDPSNNTYKMAYNKVNSSRSGGYRTERRRNRDDDSGCCNACTGLICADCCCECFGGDLIPCC